MIALLSRHKTLAVLLAAAYSVLVISGHGTASAVADRASNALTREVFNGTITVSLLAGLVFAAFFFRRGLKAVRETPFGTLFALCTPLLAAAAYNLLLVTNVECIHFLQYALLTIPLFALSGSYGATVLWTTLVGIIDETWQYFGLYGDNLHVYYDFNDIILNLIGAGIGVTAIYLLRAGRGEDISHGGEAPGRARNAGLYLPSLLGIFLALTIVAGLVRVYPAAAAGRDALLLSRAAAPTEFWTHFPWGKTYHVLNPFEGLLLAQGLMLFYGLMDRRGKGVRREA